MSKTAAMDRPAPPPAPSHAQFLLSQTRSSLAHLRTCGALDAATFAEVDRLLTGAVLKEETPSGAVTTRAETEEEKLGRRNAWLRDTLRDTSLLPTLVETALSIAIPGPILSDNQKEAIVDLVERSQSSIAEAVTNPKIQRKAQSGAYGTAKSSYVGIRKGLNAAGQSMSEMARRREEARLKAEEKKAEKEGKKSMKEELKREREAIIKQRQQDMLEGSSSSVSLGTLATAASTDSSAAKRASATSRPDLVASPTALSSATASSRAPSLVPPQTEHGIDPDEASMDVDGSALATVTCNRIPSPENNSVAATTQFSPWPGLLLSQTLVAISDEPIPSIRFGFGQIPEESNASSSVSVPPPRRTAPPPAREPSSSAPRQDPDQETATNDDGDEDQRQQQQREARLLSRGPPPAPASEQGLSSKDQAQHPTQGGASYASMRPPSHAPTPTPNTSTPLPPPVRPPSPSTDRSPPTPAKNTAPPPHSAQAPRQQQPASSFTSSSSHPPSTSTTNQVQDVTEQKNKSWTKKLGL